ncbi:MAG: hypothetical protein JXA89_01655 [Anaerolineae bacterium]|nr:hypothetical protein [Anaerolineae bacterium]
MLLKIALRKTTVGLALLLGILLTASLLTGMALMQTPDKEKGIETQAVERESYWLVLDSARPVAEVLPPLLDILTALRANGTVIDFDSVPQASVPGAVPGVRVVIAPGRLAMLRSLPGVLDVSTVLPPPPAGVSILATTGSITGQVTEAGSGVPLSGIFVEIYDAVSRVFLDYTSTDGNGFYDITVTAPYNQAKLVFNRWSSNAYIQQWYNNKAYFYEADKVNVGGVVTNVSPALGRKGVISGTVTDARTGVPLENVEVDIYDLDYNDIDYLWTDNNGQFLTYVLSGTYRILLNAWSDEWEWYQDKTWFEEADLVTVTNGLTTTITAQISRTCIAGTVTGDGQPLAYAEVRLYMPGDDRAYGSATTDAAGGYELCYIWPSNYQISFNYFPTATTWYNGQVLRSSANIITVTAGAFQTVNGDIGTDLGGCISGKATYWDGTAARPYVYILEASGQVVPAFYGDYYNSYWDDSGWTDDDGSFVACGLSAGNYTVLLNDYRSEELRRVTAIVAAGQNTDMGVVIIGDYPPLYLPLVIR